MAEVNEAIQDYACAIAIRPTMAEAHANLASAYKDSGHVEAAIKSYKKDLLLRPEFPEATCNLLHTLQCVCDWDDREKMFIEVEGILKRQIKSIENHFPSLALALSQSASSPMAADREGIPFINSNPVVPQVFGYSDGLK